MFARLTLAHLFLLATCSLVSGQMIVTPGAALNPGGGWRPVGHKVAAANAAAILQTAAMSRNTTNLPAPVGQELPAPATSLVLGQDDNAPTITRVSAAMGTLPNDQGQVWREYDLSPYTLRVKTTDKPQQAIVDWIIRETGTEVWFTEPLGMLSATGDTLRVYHTPQMQAVVKEIVDRFVGSQADAHSFGIRLVTIKNPDWRSKAHRLLKPVAVQSPGLQAWITSKEDAAVFLTQLQQRTDFREHNSANLMIHNGQTGSLGQLRPRTYVKNVLLRNDVSSYQIEMAELDEGYTLEISPLVSNDGSVVDAVIKAKVDQVEKFKAVSLDVPTVLDPRQKVEIQVPQIVSWRLHERFRWPTDQVLIVSVGVVARPGAGRDGVGALAVPNIPNPFDTAPPRADALMLLEAKGATSQQGIAAGSTPSTPAVRTGAINYNGRY